MRNELIKKSEKFMTKEAAINAFTATHYFFLVRGFLTTSYVNLETGTIELTVHFELSKPPRLPEGYKFSKKEITSHTYYSDDERRLIYVRCLRLSFEY